jgi:hypothetical protein
VRLYLIRRAAELHPGENPAGWKAGALSEARSGSVPPGRRRSPSLCGRRGSKPRIFCVISTSSRPIAPINSWSPRRCKQHVAASFSSGEGRNSAADYQLVPHASSASSRVTSKPIIIGETVGLLLNLLARLNAQNTRQAVITICSANVLAKKTIDLFQRCHGSPHLGFERRTICYIAGKPPDFASP